MKDEERCINHRCLVTINPTIPTNSDLLGFLQTSQFTVGAYEWRTHAAGRLDLAERKERPDSCSGIACGRCWVDTPSHQVAAHTVLGLVHLLLDTQSEAAMDARHSAGSLELGGAGRGVVLRHVVVLEPVLHVVPHRPTCVPHPPPSFELSTPFESL